MADRDSGEDLSKLVAELVTTLEDLEDELDPPDDRPLRPPTPRELRLFTSDVAIPGLILVLETNIRALRLLQRALRLSERADRTRRESEELGERARDVSETTLNRLDDALADLQEAVEGRPSDDEATDLLTDARELRSEVQTRLREYAEDARGSDDGAVDIAVDDAGGDEPDSGSRESESSPDGSAGDDVDGEDSSLDGGDTDEGVAVDVDAELESIKRELGDDVAHAADGDAPDEDASGEDASDGDTPDENAPDEGASGEDASDGDAPDGDA